MISLADIPYAINNAKTLADIGRNIYDSDQEEKGLMSEGAIRNYANALIAEELINSFNGIYKRRYFHILIFLLIFISLAAQIIKCLWKRKTMRTLA